MPKIVRLHQLGGPEALRIDDLPARVPGPGEARLKVTAAALSRDQFTFMRGENFRGHGFEEPPLPSLIGYEIAGIVDAVGDGVPESWIGQAVAPIAPFDQSRYGGLGEEAIVPANLLYAYPERFTPAQAASMWVPYLTAYGLIHAGNIRAGSAVVLSAAASAVGAAALQLVRDVGATPIGTVRTPARASQLHGLGVADVIVTNTEDYTTRIAEITGGHGADVTFDAIGGSFARDALAAAAPYGTVIEYGRLGGTEISVPAASLLGKCLNLRGYNIGEILSNPAHFAAATDYLQPRWADGRFTPTVAETFTLDHLADAYHAVEESSTIGRVTITFA